MVNKNWLVVGVSGATNSGKTTVANMIKKHIKDAVIFHQDKYFLPPNDPRHVKVEELNHNNWDILTAVDMNKLHQDILQTLNQTTNDQKITKVLIIDGFLIFNYKPIADLCDLRYFLYLNKGICSERRKTRNYDPPDVLGYFDKIVWPEYKRHYEEILANVELCKNIEFIDGSLPQEDTFQKVYNAIKIKLVLQE